MKSIFPKIQSILHLYDVLPENERSIVDVLRQVTRAHTPPYVKEKIAYNVPFFFGNRGICIIWPSFVPRGGITEGVLFGLWHGNQLADKDHYLTRGSNKKNFIRFLVPQNRLMKMPSANYCRKPYDTTGLRNTKNHFKIFLLYLSGLTPIIMNRTISCIIGWLLLAIPACAQTYISNVTVVDVVHQKLIPDQTVVIKNGIINAMQSSKDVRVPAGADIIAGKGKFLMPGLTDAHVHFFQSGGLYARPDALDLRKFRPYEQEIKWVHNNMEDLLRRYVRLGITSVIDVGSTYNFLEQRDSFATKDYAPEIFMTGPLLTSYEPEVFKALKNDDPFILVKTPEEGAKDVRDEILHHPDFIKIWFIVKQDSVAASARRFVPVLKAIIDEAHKNSLKVAVHATEQITAQLAVENGCDYLVHEVEDQVVSDDFVRLLQEKKIIVCPTLVVADGYTNTFGQQNRFSTYDLQNSNPGQIGSLTDLQHLPDSAMFNFIKKRLHLKQSVQRFARLDSNRSVNLKKMADGGVTIVAGTDAGNIGTQHAASLYPELTAMKNSGLTNWQIIQAATINPFKFLNKEDSLGSIAVGKKADMILLKANPIENLDNLTKIDVVINKGYALHPDSLIAVTPVMLVQQQLNAYNAGNLDAFLAPYDDSVEIYQFPDQLISKGKEALRQRWSPLFASNPGLHCEIKERIMQGHSVIDKESITGMGKNREESTAIYEIEKNKITRVYLIQ